MYIYICIPYEFIYVYTSTCTYTYTLHIHIYMYRHVSCVCRKILVVYTCIPIHMQVSTPLKLTGSSSGQCAGRGLAERFREAKGHIPSIIEAANCHYTAHPPIKRPGQASVRCHLALFGCGRVVGWGQSWALWQSICEIFLPEHADEVPRTPDPHHESPEPA